MISERQQNFITQLRDWVSDHYEHTETAERDGFLYLRFATPIYESGKEMLTEVALMEYSDFASVAQIYTTLIFGPEPGLDALREKLPEWNFASLAGSYGIYEKQGQLYHKQNVAVANDINMDEQVDIVFTGLCVAMAEISRRLPEALAISAGLN